MVESFHLRVDSGDKDAVLGEINSLLDRRLPEGHFYMASFGRTANGGYGMSVDVGGPEPAITTS